MPDRTVLLQVFAKEQSLGGSKHLIGGCAISVDRAHETRYRSKLTFDLLLLCLYFVLTYCRKVGLSGSIQYQTSWVKLKSDHVLPKTPKLKLDLAYEKTSQSETAEDSFMYQTDEVSLMETEPAPHTEVVLNEEKVGKSNNYGSYVLFSSCKFSFTRAILLFETGEMPRISSNSPYNLSLPKICKWFDILVF